MGSFGGHCGIFTDNRPYANSMPMKWIQRNGNTCSGYYQIYFGVHGYDLWFYSPKHSGCLGRRFPTLKFAQEAAEKHKAKESAEA